MNNKVLITGGAGFIGSHLVEAYLGAGFDVVVVDRKQKPEYLKSLPITYYREDISGSQIEYIFEKEMPEIINHHAALIHVKESFDKPVEYTSTNVLATIQLLELGKKYQIKQFLFASSAAIYGNSSDLPLKEDTIPKPMSFYGLDKLMAEFYIQLYSEYFATTIFRYANVYGPRQTSSAEGGVVAIFCEKMARNIVPTIFGDGNQIRDFIYVKDIALANLITTQNKISGLMQVSTGSKTTINQLYNNIANLAGFKNIPIYGQKIDGDIDESVMSNQKAKQLLSWKPKFSLDQGLKETWEYFKGRK